MQTHGVTYPSFISGVYNSVQQMYRLHFDQCDHIPEELKARVSTLKDSHTSNRGGRKQYWIESAKRIGLVDTSFGIHYGRDPDDPLPPLGEACDSSSISVRRGSAGSDGDDDNAEWGRGASLGSGGSLDGDDVAVEEIVDTYPLVTPEDRPLITDYLYLALEQMQPCNLMDADRVGCYKGRRTGFPGLACKHCIGQAGCGRYFPASEASLSQTTTSQTIVNHVRNCRRCPMEIREQLELMKRAKTCPEYKKVVSDLNSRGFSLLGAHACFSLCLTFALPPNRAISQSMEDARFSSTVCGAEFNGEQLRSGISFMFSLCKTQPPQISSFLS